MILERKKYSYRKLFFVSFSLIIIALLILFSPHYTKLKGKTDEYIDPILNENSIPLKYPQGKHQKVILNISFDYNLLVEKKCNYRTLINCTERISNIRSTLSNLNSTDTSYNSHLVQLGVLMDKKEIMTREIVRLYETILRNNTTSGWFIKINNNIEKGEFNKANSSLDKGKLIENQKEAFKLSKKTNINADSINRKLEDNANKFIIKARLTSIDIENKNRVNESKKLFEFAINSNSSVPNIFEYALFLQDNGFLVQSEYFYQFALNKIRLQSEEKSVYDNVQAVIYHNLALIYWENEKLFEAENFFKLAYNFFNSASENNPEFSYYVHNKYRMINIASFYSEQKIYDKNIYYVSMLIEDFELQRDKNPYYCLRILPNLYNNIGVSYYELKKYNQGEVAYKKSIHYLSLLDSLYSEKDLDLLTAVYDNLAQLYAFTGRNKLAISTCYASINLYKKQLYSNPTHYSLKLFLAYYYLYHFSSKYDQNTLENYVYNALFFNSKLLWKNKKQHFDKTATLLYYLLGLDYKSYRKTESTDHLFNEIVSIYKTLASQDEIFDINLKTTYYDAAIFHYIIGYPKEADSLYLIAHSISNKYIDSAYSQLIKNCEKKIMSTQRKYK